MLIFLEHSEKIIHQKSRSRDVMTFSILLRFVLPAMQSVARKEQGDCLGRIQGNCLILSYAFFCFLCLNKHYDLIRVELERRGECFLKKKQVARKTAISHYMSAEFLIL